MARKINVEQLKDTITKHLKHRNDSDVVHLLWHGYLAALMIEGFLTPDENSELCDLLRNIGRDELVEIFLGLDGPGST